MTTTATCVKTSSTAERFFEDAADRNQTFEELEYIINNLMAATRFRTMIRAARMDPEDVRQELVMEMLMRLDKYDPKRCPNLEAYLTTWLKYRLLHLRDNSRLLGMPNAPRRNFKLYSLTLADRQSAEMELPVEDDVSDASWVEQEIDALPEKQRTVVERLLSGARVSPQNKNLQAAREHLRFRVKVRQLQFA